MTNWYPASYEPPTDRPLIVYCPSWCATRYQVCEWDGKKFTYPEQPNEGFNDTVVSWALFMEAD